ncbi:cell division protein FtsA [Croceibacterium sp. TMG7-5b_MA50]|uniref:cell division protein FtsA n=1 Tax=Croceibacterium sp. TMG7-5b_MA50 TaxID=3121290 RepID=UPI0032215849
MADARITRVIGAVNLGSFRISAMIAGLQEDGTTIVLGSGHRASQGIKRGFVTDMAAATYAVRDAVERAEKLAGTAVQSVAMAGSGAGLVSRVDPVEIEVGGRRVEEDDLEQLLLCARDALEPDGRMVLHAQPGCYFLDGADGVANPVGLHADRLGVGIHQVLAEGAPMRNLREAVQSAHLEVSQLVASPLAAALACLSAEERDLGIALVEFGAQVTTISLHAAGALVDMVVLPTGSADITDAVAGAFGIRRHQAERLKCFNGSAIASPADHREMIPVAGPGEEGSVPQARGADDRNRISRADLVSTIVVELERLAGDIARALEAMGFAGAGGRQARGQVVLTGGGAELTGLADYMQAALGRPVRIGKPPALKGLPEAHATPGFATLAGLVLQVLEDPADIRALSHRTGPSYRAGGLGSAMRLWRAMKEYF